MNSVRKDAKRGGKRGAKRNSSEGNPYLSMGLKMLLGGCIGGVIGFVCAFGVIHNGITGMLEGIHWFQVHFYMEIMAVIILCMLVWNIACLSKIKGLINQTDKEESEDTLFSLDGQIDKWTSIINVVNAILFTLNFMEYGVYFVAHSVEEWDQGDFSYGLFKICLFLLVSILYCIFYIITVKMIKKYDPSKKGNPGSMRFQKDWLASCDEAERMRIYKEGYESQTSSATIMAIGFMVTVVVAILYPEVGSFAIYVVGVMWIAQNVCCAYHNLKNKGEKYEAGN